jgi:PAS domain-containing protein
MERARGRELEGHRRARAQGREPVHGPGGHHAPSRERGPGGRPDQLSDVAEELRLSRELKRTRSFAETLLEAPDAMVMVNGDGTVRLVNAALERMFGYRREELMGQPVEVLIPERDRAVHQSHRHDFLAAAVPGRWEPACSSTGQRRRRVPGRDQPQSTRYRGRPAGDGGDSRCHRADRVRAGAERHESPTRDRQSRQGQLPGQHRSRAPHAAERDPRIHRNAADGAAGAR